jgi:hypothetical protein
MNKTIFATFCLCLMPLIANAGEDLSSRLIGTWILMAHRHDIMVTYKADGTYKSVADGATIKGNWKIEGDKLFEFPRGKGPTEPSTILFENSDVFTLDGAFRYNRAQR